MFDADNGTEHRQLLANDVLPNSVAQPGYIKVTLDRAATATVPRNRVFGKNSVSVGGDSCQRSQQRLHRLRELWRQGGEIGRSPEGWR